MEAYTHTNEMKKYRAGFLIKEILDRFKIKSQSLLQPDRSIWIYSAHDTTIVNVLNALNLYEVDIMFIVFIRILVDFINKFFSSSFTHRHSRLVYFSNCTIKMTIISFKYFIEKHQLRMFLRKIFQIAEQSVL